MLKADYVSSNGGGAGLFGRGMWRVVQACWPVFRPLFCGVVLSCLVASWSVALAASNCCVDQGVGNAGCDSPSCESCVCAIDPQCCDAGSFYWDIFCAARAANPTECAAECTCGTCGDGVINQGEECDEGANNQPGISCCSSNCEILSGGNQCRGIASDPTADFSCDVAETCTAPAVCVGGSNNGGTCTGPLDCDPQSGGKCSVPCPADTVETAGSPCRNSNGVCDPAESCDGSSPLCPNDAKSSALCRGSAGVCDLPDFCDGVNNNCPADAKSTSVCRPVADVCDVAEFCDGVNNGCPANGFVASNVICRGLGVGGADIDCDVVENCTGTGPSCPSDSFRPDGTICAGTDANACKDACVTGQCTPNTPVTQQSCCGNGIVDPGEQCDDGNQVSGDSCPSLPGDDCQFAASGILIRGSRRNPAKDKKDCQVEWAVTDSKDTKDRYLLPNFQQHCRDQDPTCDFDPTPGRCRFQVSVCLNNTDPSISCGAAPNGVATVELQPPLRRYSKYPIVGAQATANSAQIQAALTSLLDPNNPGLGYTNAPPLSPPQRNFCSQTMLLEAFSSEAGAFDAQTLTMRFKTKSTDETFPRPLKQKSELRLTCDPRPLQ